MYLFFDKNGTLLERVNDSAFRQHNVGANKLYIYIQDGERPNSGKISESIIGLTQRYLKPNGKVVEGTPVTRPQDGSKYLEGVFEYKQIPILPKRDVKHFVYGRNYEFFVLSIPSSRELMTDTEDGNVSVVVEDTALDVSGVVMGTITTIHGTWSEGELVSDNRELVLERLVFTVEDSGEIGTGHLTGSQFAWLLSELIKTKALFQGAYDYDKQNNKPIINADLNADDFVPVEGTYYRDVDGKIYYHINGVNEHIDGITKVTLNGQETEKPSFYAPTNHGDATKHQVLVSFGRDTAPQWKTLRMTENGNLNEFSLWLGENKLYTITIPTCVYVDKVEFVEDTNEIKFTYNKESGKEPITINLDNLYEFGNGLVKTGKSVSIKPADEYLTVDENGLGVNAQTIADLAKIGINGTEKVSKDIDIYVPTQTRIKNTDNGCFVLVPNGDKTEPIWQQLTIESDDLVHTIKLGGFVVGKIELTKHNALESVEFDEDTNELIFTYSTEVGTKIVKVNLSDLIDVYEAGNGLMRVGNVFSVKIADESAEVLESTANGLKLNVKNIKVDGVVLVASTEEELDKAVADNKAGSLVAYMVDGDVYLVTASGKKKVGGEQTIESIVVEGTEFVITFKDGRVERTAIDYQDAYFAEPTIISYNVIGDKPILNTNLIQVTNPIAKTYYRHTGPDTNTYTNGVIYYFDGEQYNAFVGGSSGSNIVTTSAELDEAIAKEKKGTLISYIGESGGGEAVGTPFEVGDEFSIAYVNVNSEPDLSGLNYAYEGDNTVGICELFYAPDVDETSSQYMQIIAGKAPTPSGDDYYLLVVHQYHGPIWHYSSMDMPDQNTIKGWSTPDYDNGGAFVPALYSSFDMSSIYNRPLTVKVERLEHAECLASFFSKTPFIEGGSGYKKDTLYMVTDNGAKEVGGETIKFKSEDKGKFLVVGDDGSIVAESMTIGENMLI
jgi:hypothetical protein